ncbi:AI-2E family transporter [Derxia gummosa]|uniref:AI-2E family transporter n=1 Tax=Derxia gummosa DSM 723 TaxID=1121388 RepID=A0A8B6XAN8_9BURK|nr:AI-2E family transporter [Derxia gummosa]
MPNPAPPRPATAGAHRQRRHDVLPDHAFASDVPDEARASSDATDARALRRGTVVRRPRGERMLVAVLGFGGLLYLMRWSAGFLIPLAYGVVIAFALNPAVVRLQKRGLPRALGAALVLGALWTCGITTAVKLQDNVEAMVDTLPAASERMAAAVRELHSGDSGFLGRMQKALATLERAALSQPSAPRGNAARAPEAAPAGLGIGAALRDWLLAGSAGALVIASQTLLVSFLAFFLLTSGENLKRNLVRVAGRTLSHKKTTVRVLYGIAEQIQYALAILVVTNVLYGLGVWLAFALLGMNNAALWGLAAGVLHTIPYIGTVIVTAAGAIGGFMQEGTAVSALGPVAANWAISTLIGMLVTPWLQSRSSRIDPAVMFVGLMLFSWLWGVGGLLLAAPIVAIVKVVCDRVESLRPYGDLMDGRPWRRVVRRVLGRPVVAPSLAEATARGMAPEVVAPPDGPAAPMRHS